MDSAISKPREAISEYAPHITTIKVNTEKIKDIIGPGGKIIRKIIADTGATIDIEDDGTVAVASTDAEASKKALDIINKIQTLTIRNKLQIQGARSLCHETY